MTLPPSQVPRERPSAPAGAGGRTRAGETASRHDGAAHDVVVLVSASWAGPSRPAPTVLRELGRRWRGALRTLLVEEPDDDLVDSWRIEFLPTWLRFRHGGAAVGEVERRDGHDGHDGLIVPDLRGAAPSGEIVTLPGPWRLVHRRSGALPKHVVEAEFGPDS